MAMQQSNGTVVHVDSRAPQTGHVSARRLMRRSGACDFFFVFVFFWPGSTPIPVRAVLRRCSAGRGGWVHTPSPAWLTEASLSARRGTRAEQQLFLLCWGRWDAVLRGCVLLLQATTPEQEVQCARSLLLQSGGQGRRHAHRSHDNPGLRVEPETASRPASVARARATKASRAGQPNQKKSCLDLICPSPSLQSPSSSFSRHRIPLRGGFDIARSLALPFSLSLFISVCTSAVLTHTHSVVSRPDETHSDRSSVRLCLCVASTSQAQRSAQQHSAKLLRARHRGLCAFHILSVVSCTSNKPTHLGQTHRQTES